MKRRTFVSHLVTAGAAVTTVPHVFGATTRKIPTVGLIGSGWYGGVSLTSLMRDVGARTTALCDVNAEHLNQTLQLVAQYQDGVPRTFADYRKMLEHDVPDIVIVATPDHWHALPAIAAMRAGADVFLEKPIGVDVLEGEAMLATARQYDRVVQVNTQRRSVPVFGLAKEKFIESGRLGDIGLVKTFCFMGMGRAGASPVVPVPAHLDYESWTGPAPLRPFTARKEERGWRRYQEYGNGIIGDMGVHKIDIARWMLGLGWPLSVSSTGGIRFPDASDATTTDHQLAVLEFPHLRMTWEHRTWGKSPIVNPRHWSDHWGVTIVGTEGTLECTMLHYTFTPTGSGAGERYHALSPDGDPANADFQQGLASVIGVAEKNHAEDFMRARLDRRRPIADIEGAHISSACCQLANIALELGRPVAYDPTSRTVPGDVAATKLLARRYRESWAHPASAQI